MASSDVIHLEVAGDRRGTEKYKFRTNFKPKKQYKNMPYFADPMIVPRVKQYLEDNKDKMYVDIDEMVTELQRKYKDYSKKKRIAFKSVVEKAFTVVLDLYRARDSSQDQDDSESSDASDMEIDSDELDLIEDNNDANKQVVDLYMQQQAIKKMAAAKGSMMNSDKELIDLSSDEEDDVQVSLKRVKPSEVTQSSDNMKSTLQPSSNDATNGHASNIATQTQTQPTESSLSIPNSNIPNSAVASQTPLLVVGDRSSRKRKAADASSQPVTKSGDTPRRRRRDVPFHTPYSSFKDVGGCAEVLQEVCKLLIHIRHPEVFEQIGVSPPRGFLLHGPPGCGKSLLANAIAGELGVPLLKVAAPELVAGVSGESEERIRDLFDQAVSLTPCVLFLDEIDAITPNRNNAQREMERRIVAQLLTCLDELGDKEGGSQVLVLGATNRPDALDPALRRAGRFDREVCMGIPDRKARAHILRVVCGKLALSPDVASDAGMDMLAAFTPGFVGADLTALTREAAMVAVNRVFSELKDQKKKENKSKSEEEHSKLEDVQKTSQSLDKIQEKAECLDNKEVSEEEQKKQDVEAPEGDVEASKGDVEAPKGQVEALKGEVEASKEEAGILKGEAGTLEGEVEKPQSETEKPSVEVEKLNQEQENIIENVEKQAHDKLDQETVKPKEGAQRLHQDGEGSVEEHSKAEIEVLEENNEEKKSNQASEKRVEEIQLVPDVVASAQEAESSEKNGGDSDAVCILEPPAEIIVNDKAQKTNVTANNEENSVVEEVEIISQEKKGEKRKEDEVKDPFPNKKSKSDDEVEVLEMDLDNNRKAEEMHVPNSAASQKTDDICIMLVDEAVTDEAKTEEDIMALSQQLSTFPGWTPELCEMVSWLQDTPPLSAAQLSGLRVTMADFQEALRHVQPSAKREGFATVPDVTWDDVGSLGDVRSELQLAILAPVRYPEQFQQLGLNVPTGVLLCGPPGCGKTLLAKAVANEAGINFISVKGPELLNMYVGESERAVRQVFQRARSSVPCVIFFDELDALCPKRSDSGDNGVSSRVVNQLLTEMDGVEGRTAVFLMAATNRPDIIDPAVMRPGRLDKILYVGLPNAGDRVDILRALTKNGTKPTLAPDVNLAELAKMPICEGYTGADLAALVREAGVQALRELMGSGADVKEKSLAVSNKHFVKAMTKIRPSVTEKDQKHYEKLKRMYTAVPEDQGDKMDLS